MLISIQKMPLEAEQRSLWQRSADRFFPSFLNAVLVIFLMCWSWRQWVDAVVDGGWNLYTFWKVSEGQVLYRDIADAFGPFSVYFCASLFKLFGASVKTLALFDAFLLWITAQMIFRIFSWLGNRRSGMVVSCCFLLLFAFSQYSICANYNFVVPYKFEALHGTFFVVALVWLFVGYSVSRRSFIPWLAGLCVGASLTTCAEIAASATIASILWLAFLFLGQDQDRRRCLGRFAAGAAVVPGGFFALLWLRQGFPLEEAFEHTFSAVLAPLQHQNIAQTQFYQHVVGTDQLGKNLFLMAISATGYLAVFLATAALARATRAWPATSKTLLGAAGLVAGSIAAYLPYPSSAPLWESIFRGLPLFSAAACVASLIVAVQKARTGPRGESERWLMAGIWAAVSLLLILRTALNAMLPQYGFFVTMPAALLFVFVLTSAWPAWLKEKGWNGQSVQLILLGILAAMVLVYFQRSTWYYKIKDVPVGSGSDVVMGMNPRVTPDDTGIAEAVAWLQANTPPFASVVVLPDGLLINYLARRAHLGPTTMSYLAYLVFGEETILNPWKKTPPDFVVLIPRDTSEFGVPRFGTSLAYGKNTMDWVRQNYERVYGAYGAEILRRRPLLP